MEKRTPFMEYEKIRDRDGYILTAIDKLYV